MKSLQHSCPALVLILALCAACSAPLESAPQHEASPVQHVIIIGVDALSANGINIADTPVLDRLMDQGAYTLTARAVLPTSSSSNWKSMVSASTPPLHGVTSNSWERDDYTLPPAATGMEDIFPTLFGELRQQQPDATIAAVYAWDGFGRLIERSALNYDVGGRSDADTAQLAAEYLTAERPDLMFVHLDYVDHVGHDDGHKTEAYYQAVSDADALIGVIVDAAESAGMMDETVFIISSDHGGIGYGHGGESLDELEIPFIVYGAGITSGYSIREYVNVQDVAATAAQLLAIEPHPAWVGRPILSTLVSRGDLRDSPGMAAIQTPLTKPTVLPAEYLYEPAGGFYLDETATLEIVNNVDGAQIRYTLDGTDPGPDTVLYRAPVTLVSSHVVKARAFVGERASQTATGYYRLADSNAGNGIRYSYYEGEEWSFLPVFDSLQPVSTGTTYQFRVGDINTAQRHFGIVFEAELQVDEGGEHKFYTYSDDGSKLFINGQEVVNNDGAHGTIERSGAINLQPGRHDIRVEYFNEAGGYWLEVMHKAPGQAKSVIMPDMLYPKSL